MNKLRKNGALQLATQAIWCEGLCQHGMETEKGEERQRGVGEKRIRSGKRDNRKRELRTSSENKEPEFGVVKVVSETD